MNPSHDLAFTKPTASDVKRLVSLEPLCVSMYVPVSLAWNERDASPLRVRAALDEVRQKLDDAAIDGLDGFESTLDALEHPVRGIAVFCAPNGLEAFALSEAPRYEVAVLDSLCDRVLAFGGDVHPLPCEAIPEHSLAVAVLR
jgi:hypothetical protein